jgi:hypothetical protein
LGQAHFFTFAMFACAVSVWHFFNLRPLTGRGYFSGALLKLKFERVSSPLQCLLAPYRCGIFLIYAP